MYVAPAAAPAVMPATLVAPEFPSESTHVAVPVPAPGKKQGESP
jgi:hypothetical protein